MYVKMLDGRYAGQVRDLSNEAAMGLLAQGRVARAFVDEAVIAPRPAAALPEAEAQSAKPAKKEKKARR